MGPLVKFVFEMEGHIFLFFAAVDVANTSIAGLISFLRGVCGCNKTLECHKALIAS